VLACRVSDGPDLPSPAPYSSFVRKLKIRRLGPVLDIPFARQLKIPRLGPILNSQFARKLKILRLCERTMRKVRLVRLMTDKMVLEGGTLTRWLEVGSRWNTLDGIRPRSTLAVAPFSHHFFIHRTSFLSPLARAKKRPSY
jgi:hypothetical protein